MDKYISKVLTERQEDVVAHIAGVGGFDLEQMQYIKSEEYFDDPSSIDIAIFAPTENFGYYLVSTVGLSSYQPDPKLARAEIFMLLPPSWKWDMEKEEYSWPVQMLRDVANGFVNSNKGVELYLLIKLADDVYSEGTDTIGGVLCFPEMNALEFVEEKIGDTYTRFFDFVPLNKAQFAKIEDVGVKAFVEYDLHDADGPVDFVAQEPKIKKGSNIDKIIEHNTNSLNKKG